MSEHTVTLKEFIDEKFSNLERSTELARVSMEKRLDGMNEFRETLKDQAAKFITRNEYESMMNNYSKDIRELRESKAMLEGKASQGSVNVAYVLSGIAIVVPFLIKLLTK